MEDFSREWFESLWQKPLNEIIKEGMHQLVKMAVKAEFEAFLAMHSQLRDEQGRAAVVRNGHNPERLRLGHWNLRFGIYLGFGAWCLEF